MAGNKSRSQNLTPSVRQFIYSRAINQRNIPRDFLAKLLIEEIKGFGEVYPSLETAKRYISDARNAGNPLDEPWSIACSSEYSSFFPPDSIPILMDYKQLFYKFTKDGDESFRDLFGDNMSDFSIRHAKWFIRLRPLIDKILNEQMETDEHRRFGHLFFTTMVYEVSEMTCEILGVLFVSTGLDNALVSGDFEAIGKIGGLAFLSASKPANCDHECESCKYIRIPGFTKMCMPRPKKDGDK